MVTQRRAGADDNRLNDEELLDALIGSREVRELGALIDDLFEHKRGRKREHPGWIWVVYLALISEKTSSRAVGTFMTNEFVRRRLAYACPKHSPERSIARRKPMTRYQFDWLRQRIIASEDFWALAHEKFGDLAVALAKALDVCADPTAGYTKPPLASCLFGDGKTIAAYSGFTPRGEANKKTGEIIKRRFDPDARNYTNGAGEVVYGHHFTILSGRNGHTNENVILGFDYVTPKTDGGEVGVALRIVKSIVDKIDARAVVYDTALRGKHIDRLYDLGLLSVAPVAPQKRATAKTERVAKEAAAGFAMMPTPSGTSYEVAVQVVDGKPHLVDVDHDGNEYTIDIELKKVAHRPLKKGGHTFYGEYQTPNGDTINIRLDSTDDDKANGFNRAENLRPFPPGTDGYKRLYNYRPTTESINRSVERSLGETKRAHSYTKERVRLDMLGFAILNNVKAACAFERRRSREQTAA